MRVILYEKDIGQFLSKLGLSSSSTCISFSIISANVLSRKNTNRIFSAHLMPSENRRKEREYLLGWSFPKDFMDSILKI